MLKVNILDKYGSKNPQKNTIRLYPAAHQKDYLLCSNGVNPRDGG
jgi:hypothetical protein